MAGVGHRPRPKIPVWEWAAKNVRLNAQASARPGFYDPALVPFTKLLQDEFILSRHWRECIVEKSSQTGFTEAALNIVRWMPEHWPGPVLYAIDREQEAINISKFRLAETIRKRGGAAASDKIGQLRIELDNMYILLTGAASVSPFRNKYLKLGVLDEVESHKLNMNIGEEGSTIDLMRSRFTTSSEGKMIAMSKTGLRGGIINRECESGSLHKCYVPCPKCGTFQVLESQEGDEPGRLFPEQLRFAHLKGTHGWELTRFEREVFWECISCNAQLFWHEHQKEMVANHEWRLTNEDHVPGRMSMRISDLYSPFPNVCWGALARQFVQASKDAASLEYLFTNHLSIAWEPTTARIKDSELLALRSGVDGDDGPVYFLNDGVCPVEPVYSGGHPLISVAVDRQDDRDKWSVVMWSIDAEPWLLAFGESMGDEQILDLFYREFVFAGKEDSFAPTAGLIDSGYRTSETYSLCLNARAEGYPINPSKGMGSNQVAGVIATRSVTLGDRQVVQRLDYNDHQLKRRWMSYLRPDSLRRLRLPMDIGEHPRFLAELTAEKLVTTLDKKGFTKEEFQKKPKQPNDWGDTMKMHLAMWIQAGGDSYNP
ncbi:MAG: terminase gpA endonuclease subunit [Verrucomicrobiota bacterium]